LDLWKDEDPMIRMVSLGVIIYFMRNEMSKIYLNYFVEFQTWRNSFL
jgi:hypothetical protein